MPSREEPTSRRQEPRRFARSGVESLVTLPRRFFGRSRLSEMSPTEKDHAHLSGAVYADPEHRSGAVRGYTHVRGEVPLGSGYAVPLNGTRWAVYRAPDEMRYVLAFRGTKEWGDLSHDLNLRDTPFGKHEYMTKAAVWSLQVMLFLARRHDNNIRLKFSLTGHSLGGTVAMGVLFLLHDVPATAQYLEAGRVGDKNSGGLPEYERYAKDFLGPYIAAKEEKTRDTPPYEIVGGDIFNPGAWPCLAPDVVGAAKEAGRRGIAAKGGGVILVFIAVRAYQEVRHAIERRQDRDVEPIDSLITTHHILGDLISKNFGLGREKSYLPSKLIPHSIANFL